MLGLCELVFTAEQNKRNDIETDLRSQLSNFFGASDLSIVLTPQLMTYISAMVHLNGIFFFLEYYSL